MAGKIDARLKELGITLPDAPVPYNGGLESRYLPNAPYVTQQIDALVSTGRAPQAWWKQAS